MSFAASYVFWSDRTSEREQLYLDALRSEARVEVLARLVRYADPTNNPAIGRFVLRSLAHTDERVRTGALESLARPTVAARVPDAVLHIAAATSAVRSTDERIRGCSLIGSFDDPRAAGILAARLADETLPLEVYDACFAALVRTWARAPEPLQPSREGYELTLKLLNAKPRSRARQSPWGVAAVGAAHKHSPEWAQRVRDFYDVRAVSTALASVVLDDAAGLEARSKAGSALVELDQGATILSTIEASRSQGTTKSMRLADEMASKQRRKHAPPSTDPLAD